MLLDAAKHPGLPAHAIQSYLRMPSKPDARITHVLAICRVHVREVQPAAAVLPVISQTKERESYLHALPPHRGCVTTHLAGVLGAESGPQSAADFSCRSASLLWGFLLSFLVVLSVPALISIWLTFQSPGRPGSDCPLQLQPCERSPSKSSHLLNYPFTEVICTAAGGETWTPSAPRSFVRWNEAKKARSASVHAAYKLQSPRACHCPDYLKTYSLPSIRSPLPVAALHSQARGSLLAFVTTSKRAMGTTDKSCTRGHSTHPSEIGFLWSWSVGWEAPYPSDMFWWKPLLASRQIRNGQMESDRLKIVLLFGPWTSNGNKTTLLSKLQWTILTWFLVEGNFLWPYYRSVFLPCS